MADLDDFFAKKDKSKKGKKKLTTTESIGKHLEDPNKPVDKFRKEKEKSTAVVVNASKLSEQDDTEWKEVDEERDYTGLKVQALSIKDKEEEFREQKALEVEQDNKKDEEGGPWRAAGAKGEENEKDKSTEDLYSPPAPEPEKAKTKYVPPAQRDAQKTNLSKSRFAGRAPELSNAEEFPSLGDAPPPELGKDFVPVKHGARDFGVKSAVNNTVLTDNKCKALGRDFSN